MTDTSSKKDDSGIIKDKASEYLWHLHQQRKPGERIYTYPDNHRISKEDFEDKPLSRPGN